MAKGKRMKKSYDEELCQWIFEFPTLQETLKVDLVDLSEEIQTKLMYHGGLQKIGDGGAVAQDETDQACYDGVKSVIDQLLAGEWTTKRAALDTDSKQAMAWLKKNSEDRYNAIQELSGEEKRTAIAEWTEKFLGALAGLV